MISARIIGSFSTRIASANSATVSCCPSGLLSDAVYPEDAFRQTLDAHRATDISVLHARDLHERTAHWDASMISVLIPVPERHHRLLGIGLHGPTSRMTRRKEELSGLLRETAGELGAQLSVDR